jgi:hypothetical protein
VQQARQVQPVQQVQLAQLQQLLVQQEQLALKVLQ